MSLFIFHETEHYQDNINDRRDDLFIKYLQELRRRFAIADNFP